MCQSAIGLQRNRAGLTPEVRIRWQPKHQPTVCLFGDRPSGGRDGGLSVIRSISNIFVGLTVRRGEEATRPLDCPRNWACA
jgi:hypothetical protein